MGKKIVLTPSIQRILQRMGEQIKLARLRRNISMEIVAEARPFPWEPTPRFSMLLKEWIKTCCLFARTMQKAA